MTDFDDGGFPDVITVAVPQLARGEIPTNSYVLSIIEGPDTGKCFPVDASQPSRMLIGTSPACDMRVTDRHTSRRHAAVELFGRHVRITDLGSTNGTFVDGVMIVEAFLRGGEIVRIGGSAFRFDEGPQLTELSIPKAMAFGKLIGGSVAMRRLYPLCERLAASDVPIVIEGETGTGKEHLAEAIHTASARSGRPFVVFDCTAVSPNLVESELFGHERGAFTGSIATRKGIFERADGGTLLIDEIGDLPLELQPKLLRAIERAEVIRVGGERSVHVNVRVMAATRRNLDLETQEGRFRDDLFHRIAVTRIELPPLRHRIGDVALLAQHFLSRAGAPPQALSPSLMARWESYEWPGNVRELRNAVARWLALGDLQDVSAESVDGPSSSNRIFYPMHGDVIGQIVSSDLPLAEARQKMLDIFERRYVEHVLQNHGGNVTRAAAAAGVARRHLQRIKAKLDPKRE